MKLLFAGGLGFVKIQFFPNADLLFWMTAAIVLDLITGVIKAISKGEARTSRGFRETIKKLTQYLGGILAAVILIHVGGVNEASKLLFSYLNNALVFYIIYIEAVSIFENLNEIDKTSMIARYFYQPALKILTFQIKNNPIFKQAEGLKETTK